MENNHSKNGFAMVLNNKENGNFLYIKRRVVEIFLNFLSSPLSQIPGDQLNIILLNDNLQTDIWSNDTWLNKFLLDYTWTTENLLNDNCLNDIWLNDT